MPAAPTVIGLVVWIAGKRTVVPEALMKLTVATREPGVKPVPAMPTVAGWPDTPWAAAKVIVGVPRTVRVADTAKPAASITVKFSEPAGVASGTIYAAFAGIAPEAVEVTVVVFARVTVLNHVPAVPFTNSVSAEVAE